MHLSVVSLLLGLHHSVRYRLREDPTLLQTGRLPERDPATTVALAPNSNVVAVAISSSLFIFSTSSGDLMERLENVHGGEQITSTSLPSLKLRV